MADLRQITLGARAFDVLEEHVELTQAEYNALTPAEKNNGKVYFVTDGQGGGGGGGGSDDITIIKSDDLPSWNQLDAIWGTGADKVVYYRNATSRSLERVASAFREGDRVTITTHDIMNGAFGRKVTLYEFEVINSLDAPLELLNTESRYSDVPEITTILSTDTTQITEKMVRPIYRISGNLTVYELNMRVPALPNNTFLRVDISQRVNNWENFRFIQFVCGRTSHNLVINSYSGSVQSTYHQAVVDYLYDSIINLRTFTDMSNMSADITVRFSGRYIG